ncbi:MAG: hypothetical protein OXF25_09685 [Cyanobacteria bacterium MAG CAR3_bin_5]|nr:hypothetical protein [Cyanobacteria bacterium MAG CAR3_bin_5]
MKKQDLTARAEDKLQEVSFDDLDRIEPTKQDYFNEKLALENEDLKNKINQKQTYSKIFVCMGISWLVFLGAIVCANGMPKDWGRFSTSDKVMITLIATSSFPPLILVAKYLFGDSGKKNSA